MKRLAGCKPIFALAVALALAACGGGGNVVVNPPPQPAPAPQPAPQPAPAPQPNPAPQPAPQPQPNPNPPPPPAQAPPLAQPISGGTFDTPEFQRNYGLERINSLAAYNAGITGQGVTVAIIDSGIDPNNTEFDANLSPASTDIVGTRNTLFPTSSHGTGVASVVAAEKDGVGVHGVAFEATLLAIRADEEGPCTGNCGYFNSDIAAAVDYAVANGADIINISLGDDSPVGVTLTSAYQRAVNAGVIIVFAAGNGGDPAPNESVSFARSVEAKGFAIIVGASDQSGGIASFSNRAGFASRNNFVLAPGVGIEVVDIDGSIRIASGTSFAAPHVAGAAALLLQNFPNLSGADVLQILIDTASDVGLLGVDSTTGMGLINLAAALLPQGTQSVQTLAGSNLDMSGSGLQTGAAFGDALTGNQSALAALSGTVFLDRYDRTYVADLTPRIGGLPDDRFDLASFARNSVYRRAAQGDIPGIGSFQVSFTDGWGALDERDIFPNLAKDRGIGNVSFRLSHSLTPDTAITVAHGSAFAGTLDHSGVHGLRSIDSGAFMKLASDGSGVGVHHRLDRRTVIEAASAHATFSGLNPGESMRRQVAAVQVRRAVTETLEVGIRLGVLQERGSLLDTIATGAFDGIDRATTRFLTMTAAYRLGDWTFAAQASRGWTGVRENDALLNGFSDIETSAYAVAALWRTPWAGHTLGFAVAQPLRVERGSARLDVPTGRDLATGLIGFDSHHLNLSPTGREIDFELSHGFWTGGPVMLQTNLIYRLNPGHVAGRRGAIAAFTRANIRF
ncbi:MAG: S8 family peptidase [Alphaproteobacteria bacterium]